VKAYYAVDVTDEYPVLLGPFGSPEHQKAAVRLAAAQGRKVIYLDVWENYAIDVGRVMRKDGGKEVA